MDCLIELTTLNGTNQIWCHLAHICSEGIKIAYQVLKEQQRGCKLHKLRLLPRLIREGRRSARSS